MTDVFIDQCVVDGSALIEVHYANEHGAYFYYQCVRPIGHTYRAAYDGMRWSPVDQGDYDDGP